MNYLTWYAGVALCAFIPCTSVLAENRVLEITGDVEVITVPYDAIGAGENLTFKAYVFEETEAAELNNEIPFIDYGYEYSVTQVSIEVMTDEGETVFSDSVSFQLPHNLSDTQVEQPTDYTYSMFSEHPHGPSWAHQHATWFGTSNASPMQARQVELGLSFLSRLIAGEAYYQPSVDYAEETLLFVEDSLFPTFIEGSLVYPFRYHLSNDFGGDASDLRPGIFGYATHLRYVVLDADGDGILDVDDNCVVSHTDDFVTLNGQLLTVENVVDAEGCTVMDHYAACEAEQGESGFLGYSGASYCEQQVAYQLYREGLIDYADVRELRTALR